MIEKIKNKTGTYCGQTLPVRQDTIINKINELVDAVNSIVSVQEKLIDSRFVVETKHEAPADQYAEQRKWIGCLCRMKVVSWDCIYEYKVLVGINETDPANPFIAKDGDIYCECEPVKPEDDIIYKGGDNVSKR